MKVNLENGASQKLLERLGFQKEGILRDYEFEQGKINSIPLSSLLKREWQK